jgi:hypothetical protein
MVTKYDTSFSSNGKGSIATILMVGVALVAGYFVYQRFFAKPKDEKQAQ